MKKESTIHVPMYTKGKSANVSVMTIESKKALMGDYLIAQGEHNVLDWTNHRNIINNNYRVHYSLEILYEVYRLVLTLRPSGDKRR